MLLLPFTLSLLILQASTPDAVAQLLSNTPQAFLPATIPTGLGVYATVPWSKSLTDRHLNAPAGSVEEIDS